MTAPQGQFSVPSGLIVITTYGQITQQTAACLLEARSHNDKQGLGNVEYQMIPGTLVEKARNEAVRTMLKKGHGWLLMIDGDTTFQPDAIIQLLTVAFAAMPHADVVGAWVPLRGELALPTIDTGTGTWESHYPGSGILEVMRTGGAFLLCKRRVFEGLKDPWFRMRVPARALDFMAEVDNFARIKFDGQNPFRGTPERFWERLEDCARQDPSVVAENFTPTEVGEDSGFCDRARNAGFRIMVQTDIACGHVDQQILTWANHKTGMDKLEQQQRYAVGLWA
jgi:hypothetical protein